MTTIERPRNRLAAKLLHASAGQDRNDVEGTDADERAPKTTELEDLQIPSSDEPELQLPQLSPDKAQWLLRGSLEHAAETVQSAVPHCCRVLDMDPSLSSIEASEARRFIVAGAGRLSAAYALALRKRQQASLDRLLTPRAVASIKAVSVEKLALISDDLPTVDSVVTQVSAGLAGELEEFSASLQTIVGFLLHRNALRKEDNPMAPALFVASLMDAAAQIDAPAPVHDQIVLLLGPLLAAPLRGAYTEFLDRMKARGITLHSIRRDIFARQTRLQRTVAVARQEMLATTVSADQSANLQEAATTLESMLARMQQLVKSVDSAGMVFAPAPGAAPAGLLRAVHEMQIDHLPARSDQAAGFPKEDWRAALSRQAMRSVDRMAIEMVSLIFARIAQERRVPDAIRSLLMRLQMPTLKAALMDADFFVAGNHPARQLLDRIAAAAIGWTAQGDENQEFLALVMRIVDAACREFEEDMTVLERLRDEFERFIAARAQRLGTPLDRLTSALSAAETLEARVIQVAGQMQQALEGAEVAEFLRDFLVGPWARVLATCVPHSVPHNVPNNALDHAPANAQDSGVSTRFRSVIHDLLWSVRPKASADERQRLFALIPAMTRRLRDGLAAIHFPAEERRRFLQAVMQAHTSAVRPVDQATYIKSSLAFSELCARLDQMQVANCEPRVDMIGRITLPDAVVQRAVSASEAQLAIAQMPVDMRPASAIEDEDRDSQIGGWRCGTWFRLARGDQHQQAQLLWTSPMRSLFLFAADDASMYLMASPVLKAYLRQGLIDTLEDAPLTQRAIAAVLDRIARSPPQLAEVAARIALPRAGAESDDNAATGTPA